MIRATSLHAASQSFFDRRFPLTNLRCVPVGRFWVTSLRCDGLLEGRAKQMIFRNPRFTRPSKARDPINPAAPVTNTGSFFNIKYLFSDSAINVGSNKIGYWLIRKSILNLERRPSIGDGSRRIYRIASC